MKALILTAALSGCLTTVEESRCIVAPQMVPGPEDNELRALQSAIIRCPEKYGPDYCLVQWIKRTDYSFWAVCGRG